MADAERLVEFSDRGAVVGSLGEGSQGDEEDIDMEGRSMTERTVFLIPFGDRVDTASF
jgi:hypothetical protein